MEIMRRAMFPGRWWRAVTATAVEDDQADAPALSPREEHLAEWLKAMAAADKLLRQAIADELAEDLPGLEEAQAKAAEAVGETYGALKDPERDLADLDAEIGHAETELATWQSQLEEGDVAARVEARRWVAEWEAELVVLRGKREFGLAQMLAAPRRARQGPRRRLSRRPGRWQAGS